MRKEILGSKMKAIHSLKIAHCRCHLAQAQPGLQVSGEPPNAIESRRSKADFGHIPASHIEPVCRFNPNPRSRARVVTLAG
jgi:hypothetical protein